MVVGIDPGLTGAVALITRSAHQVHDMPTIERDSGATGKTGREVDARGLILLMRQLLPVSDSGEVVIEEVFAMPGMALATQTSLVDSFAQVKAVLRIARMPFRLVRPQAWKRTYGLKAGDKAASLECVRRLYPDCGLYRQKDHNKAEALLIAHWGKNHAA